MSTTDAQRIHALIPRHASAAPVVSRWSVGQHLDHTLQAEIFIAESLARSAPWQRREGFGLIKSIVLITGTIPRGRGKTPDSLVPEAQPTEAALLGLAQRAEAAVQAMHSCDPGCWIEHPVFGTLQAVHARRFAAIHTRHHLRIIADILAS